MGSAGSMAGMVGGSSFEPITGSDERYTLRSRAEILAVLRGLQKHRAMITIYFDQGREFILTTILSVNPEFEELVFEHGADSRANQSLPKASRLVAVTHQDRIRIQFSTSHAALTTHQDRPAFRMRLPDSLLRLQRRDFFRLDVPMGKAVKAYVQVDPAQPERLLEARLLDISCGGMAMIGTDDGDALEVGRVYPACSINLPGVGTVSAPLEICSIADVMLKNGNRNRRIGCRFVKLSGAMQTIIQRFINTTERERAGIRR